MSEVCHLTANDIGALTPWQLHDAVIYAYPQDDP